MAVRRLLIQNAELSRSLKEKSKGSRKYGKKGNLSDPDMRISRYAKFFGIMHEPFVDKTALLAPWPKVDSTDRGRYQSDLSKIEGVTAELYEMLPEDMHDELQSSTHFQTLVRQINSYFWDTTNVLFKSF